MRRSNTFRLAVSALFAAVIYLCSFVVIPLPFSPVPVTAHTLALTLACLILPRRESVWAVIGYLLAGLATGTVGFGLAVGYDVGFLLTALFVPVLRGGGEVWAVPRRLGAGGAGHRPLRGGGDAAGGRDGPSRRPALRLCRFPAGGSVQGFCGGVGGGAGREGVPAALRRPGRFMTE